MQDPLDIAYDVFPYDKSWSLQRLTTGAVVAASGFDKMTEKAYAVLYATVDDSHLLITSGISAPGDECDKGLVK
jgi:hypothetical protein